MRVRDLMDLLSKHDPDMFVRVFHDEELEIVSVYEDEDVEDQVIIEVTQPWSEL